MNPEEECAFMKQLHEKQTAAFRELFMNFYNALVYFAMGYVKEKEQAEDLVQELFMQILESKTKYVSYTSFKTFLCTFVQNVCVNLLKNKELSGMCVRCVRERETEMEEVEDLRVMEEEIYRGTASIVFTSLV